MNARNDQLDSAKGLLIALVVLGHWLEATNYWDEGLIRYVLTTIYAFHMPAFIFLAGLTSKPDNVKYRIALLLSLLFIFQCLYSIYLPLTESHKQFEWADPFWVLWFLLGMVWWLLTLVAAQYSPRLALLFSVLVGLGSGAVPAVEYVPALDRALYFLPWFMAGYVLGQAAFERAAATRDGPTLVLTLTSLVMAAGLWHFQIGPGWLYGSNGFAVLEVSVVHGVLMRALLLSIAFIMTWTAIAIAARLRTVLVNAGKRSLAIYLLHGFFVLAVTPWLSGTFDDYGSGVAMVMAVLGTGLLIYLLSLPVFDRGLRALGSRSAGFLLNTINSIRKMSNAV